MADLVEKFDTFKKNLASEKRARPNRRQDKIDDMGYAWEVGVGYTDKYGEGWDHIFAKKKEESDDVRGDK